MWDVVVTAGVLGALAGASMWFNGRIDGTPHHGRPDGLTAVWVVMGTAYTLAGAGVLVGVWWPVLVHVGEAGGVWAAALGVTVVTGAAFGASGAPMVWGDMRRAHGLRTVQEAIAAARDGLGSRGGGSDGDGS
jgi:hypothetical protein